MKATDLLKKQHRVVEGLFKKVEKAKVEGVHKPLQRIARSVGRRGVAELVHDWLALDHGVEPASGELRGSGARGPAAEEHPGATLPPSGQPILLMADRQTTGGYPKIATVITADLPLAGQLAPGDWIEFTPCSVVEAVAALRIREASLQGSRP